MQKTFIQTDPGVALEDIALKFAARGIQIDNPSGSWIYVKGLYQWVPPYTLGWRQNFDFAVLTIDILFPTSGPADSVSTLTGDKITIWYYDVDISESAGTAIPYVKSNPFIGFTAGGSFVAGLTSSGVTVWTSVPAPGFRKRYRILSISLSYRDFTDSPISGQFVVGGAVYWDMMITPERRSYVLDFPEGFELPSNTGFEVYGSSSFIEQTVSFHVRYIVV